MGKYSAFCSFVWYCLCLCVFLICVFSFFFYYFIICFFFFCVCSCCCFLMILLSFFLLWNWGSTRKLLDSAPKYSKATRKRMGYGGQQLHKTFQKLYVFSIWMLRLIQREALVETRLANTGNGISHESISKINYILV